MRNKKGLIGGVVGLFTSMTAGAWLLVFAAITMVVFVAIIGALGYRIRTIPIPSELNDDGSAKWPTPTNAVQEEIAGKLSANSNGWAPSALLLAKWQNGPVAVLTDEEMLEELEGVYQWTIETSTDFQNWSLVDDTFVGKEAEMEAERKWWGELININNPPGARFFRAWHP